MLLLPVIERELRAQARRPLTYWGRVCAGLVAILVFWYFISSESMLPSETGQSVFIGLHVSFLALIWLGVPLMVCDVIAQEKREGTLGLLFLTPLTPTAIVLGKVFAHAWRSISVLLAALPVMAVPIILGGVKWIDYLQSLTYLASAFLLALCTGLMASAYFQRRGVVTTAAIVFMAAAFFVQATMLGFLDFMLAEGGYYGPPEFQWLNLLGVGVANFVDPCRHSTLYLLALNYGSTAFNPAQLLNFRLKIIVWLPLSNLLIIYLLMKLTIKKVSNSQREPEISPLKTRLFATLEKPILFTSFFHRRMRAVIGKNPIAWLQQYSWRTRIIKWTWCLVIIVIESVLVSMSASNPNYNQSLLGNLTDHTAALASVLLGAGVLLTFSAIATASFLKEKETGVLELLLISPLPVRSIISGRVRGLYMQCLPGFTLLTGSAIFMYWIGLMGYYYDSQWHGWLVFGWAVFFMLPFSGLYFSLRLKRFLPAWSGAIIGAMLPWLFGVLVFNLTADELQQGLIKAFDSYWLYSFDYYNEVWLAICVTVFSLAFAGLACYLLHHSLSRRLYPM